MNKKGLVEVISSKTKLSKKDAQAALDGFTQTVIDTLSKGENIALIGFGTFSIHNRKERIGVDPSSGKKITIPSATIAKFKVGSKLKEAVK